MWEKNIYSIRTVDDFYSVKTFIKGGFVMLNDV